MNFTIDLIRGVRLLMSSGILSEVYQSTYNKYTIRQNPFEVWYDLLTYAKNLKGNWMLSEEVFNNYLAPTAIEHPEYFAKCVEEMVKTSGLKVKCKHPFLKAIKLLKTLKNKSFESEVITKALTDILNAGLQEPLYAERAIRFSGIAAGA